MEEMLWDAQENYSTEFFMGYLEEKSKVAKDFVIWGGINEGIRRISKKKLSIVM